MLREACNEVHCNLLEGEGSFICCNTVKGYFCLMSEDLILLADCASFDAVCYPLVHACPRQDFCGFLDGFVVPWMSRCGVIVDQGHEVSFR